MNRKVVIFVVLLIALVSFMAYAIDKRDPGFLDRIKIDPTTLKEKKSTDNLVSEEMSQTQKQCDTLSYYGAPAYYWPIPDPYGDDFFNERFDIPYDCYLDEIHIAFYEGGSSGSPDAHIYVWNSDGMYPLDEMPPSGAIAEFVIPHSDLVWYPDMNVIETEMVHLELVGGEPIHVGFSHPRADVQDTLSILSDDGSQMSNRSVYYEAGMWHTILETWGVGVDFFIEIVICIPSVGCCQLSPPECYPATEEECREMGGAWFPPPAECIDYPHGSFCTYPYPRTVIVEPNDTSIWDKNYFSDTLVIQAIDFQAVSKVEYTVFEYFFDDIWHTIDIDYDGTTYMRDPADTTQPGGNGWQAKWSPDLTLPEGYYMIRATMVDSAGWATSDTIVQYWDPYPPEVTIIWPDTFNFPTDSMLDIHFFTPGDNITEMYVIVYPIPDYPGRGIGMDEEKFDCIQGYNKGIPHLNQFDLYPTGANGVNQGCVPTSIAACLKYWAQNGFPCLTDSGAMNDSQMVAELAGLLGTHPDTGTPLKKEKAAIDAYIKKHCGECVFQPTVHLQEKDVTQRRLIRELFEEDEDVITGDKTHVVVANSFCVHPKFFLDYMDPGSGTEVQQDAFDKGHDGDPLIDLIIVSPKETTVTVPPDTVAYPEDIEPVPDSPGEYHYPWYPDPDLFPVGHGYFVNVDITDGLGHKGWDLVKVELFLRGDATGDGILDVGDVVYLVSYVFREGIPPFPLDAGDANCDGIVDLGDIVYMINYLFREGPPPSCD